MNTPEGLFPRDPTACAGGKQWYVCTVGNYRGCCSSDPCTTGICPDNDDNSSIASTKSSDSSLATSGAANNLPSSTLKTETSSVTRLTEAIPISEGSSTTESTLTASSTAPDITGFSSVLAATHGTSSASSTPVSIPSTTSPNRGAIIGGVLAGVAALVLLAILIFCCLRRRRKHGARRKKSRVISWYPRGPVQVRANISEIDGKQFRRNDEASRPNNIPSTVPPSRTSAGIHLTPDLVLNPSSTNRLSHSPLKPQIPPTPPLPASFYLSASTSQEFTPELQDTGFQPPRAELASHPQSEWINVPLDQRPHQNPMRGRPGPVAWGSPSQTPMAGSPVQGRSRPGHTRAQSDGYGSTPPPVGRVVTTEGVILGANLDRYSNGHEIARSLDQGTLAKSRAANHVMSFMQFSGRAEDGGLAAGCLGTGSSRDERSGEANLRRLETRVEDSIFEDRVEGDVPPAYEAGEGSLEPEIKSPSGRMGMSLRGV